MPAIADLLCRRASAAATNLPSLLGSLHVAITMMIVVIPTAAPWAGGGGVISRHVAGGRAGRIVSLGLATPLAATVVAVWI